MDTNGNAFVLWRHYDGTNYRIQLRHRSVAGRLSAVQTLSAAGGDAFGQQMAIDQNGNALVVWSRVGGTGERVQFRRRSVTGRLSAVRTLSAAGGDAELPQVALNANGAALLVWQRKDGAHWRIQVRRRSTSGGLNAVRNVSPAGSDGFRPQLAIDAANNALVVWQLYDGQDYSIQFRPRTAWGHLGLVQTLSEPGPRPSDPALSIDAGRSALAVWSHYDGANWRIQAAQPAP